VQPPLRHALSATPVTRRPIAAAAASADGENGSAASATPAHVDFDELSDIIR